MAENIFRLKRIAKKDPYVTPNTAVEKHIYDAVHEGGGSGGGSPLIVNATASGNSLVCDKTAAEMYAAFQSGGVLIRFNIEDAEYRVNVISAMKANNNGDYPNYYYFAVSTPPATGISPFMTTDGDDAYPSIRL